MSYQLKFYCQWAGDAATAAKRFKAGLEARYPNIRVQEYPPQVDICELEAETSAGSYVYISMDVDYLRVANVVAQISKAPERLNDARMVASVVLSGPRDGALLAACWTTFETGFAGTPWDEMEGFDVTLSE